MVVEDESLRVQELNSSDQKLDQDNTQHDLIKDQDEYGVRKIDKFKAHFQWNNIVDLGDLTAEKIQIGNNAKPIFTTGKKNILRDEAIDISKTLLMDLNNEFNNEFGVYSTLNPPSSKTKKSAKFGTMSNDPFMSSRKESEYKSIPNNFKTKEGVAFATTMSNINIKSGIVGIYNMGNTCFLNTAIQCLSAVQPLTDYFLGELHKIQLNITNPMGSGGKVTEMYAEMIKDMWSGKDEKIYPQEFINVLSQHAPHLVCGMQQDAQEFLAYLLDCFHEDLNRADKLSNLQAQKIKNSEKSKNDEDEVFKDLSDEKQELIACDSWKDYLFNNRSIIVDLFQGQLKSTLKCLKCDHMSIKFDCFMFLSLPIPQDHNFDITLDDCVKEFTKEEVLDEENKWKCPNCKSFQKATKKIDIWKLPSILIIHLKRFEFSQRKRGKINDLVDFPLKGLDLSEYVSKLQRDKPEYDLFAIANHEGYLGGGHYYSYTKHRNTQLWNYFNDDTVRKILDDNKVVTEHAYILFYSKMSVNQFFRQTLSEPGLWPHIITQTNNQSRSVNVKKTFTNNIRQSKFNMDNGSTELRKFTDNSLIRVGSNLVSNNNPIHINNSRLLNDDSYKNSHQSSINNNITPSNKSVQEKDSYQNRFSYRNNSNLSNIGIDSSRPHQFRSVNQRAGEMISKGSSNSNRPIVINNNNNNIVLNLYMKNDKKY